MAELPDIENLLWDLIEQLEGEKLLTKLGLAGERIIKKRTREGKDYEGKKFAPYSEGHKRKRKKLGLPVNKVNLQMDDISGMMADLKHVVLRDEQSVQLEFASPDKETLAEYHNISGAGKSRVKREFYKLADKEQERIVKLTAKELSVGLKNLERKYQ